MGEDDHLPLLSLLGEMSCDPFPIVMVERTYRIIENYARPVFCYFELGQEPCEADASPFPSLRISPAGIAGLAVTL